MAKLRIKGVSHLLQTQVNQAIGETPYKPFKAIEIETSYWAGKSVDNFFGRRYPQGPPPARLNLEPSDRGLVDNAFGLQG